MSIIPNSNKMDKLDFYLKNATFECPICHYHSGRLWEVKNPPKNGGASKVGQIFVACSNKADECRACTFFGNYPPVLTKSGTIGNTKIGLWKVWDSTQGPRRAPTPVPSGYGYSEQPAAVTPTKRKREEPESESEEEQPPKKKAKASDNATILKKLQAEIARLSKAKQPAPKPKPTARKKKAAEPVVEETEEEEEEVHEPLTQVAPNSSGEEEVAEDQELCGTDQIEEEDGELIDDSPPPAPAKSRSKK